MGMKGFCSQLKGLYSCAKMQSVSILSYLICIAWTYLTHSKWPKKLENVKKCTGWNNCVECVSYFENRLLIELNSTQGLHLLAHGNLMEWVRSNFPCDNPFSKELYEMFLFFLVVLKAKVFCSGVNTTFLTFALRNIWGDRDRHFFGIFLCLFLVVVLYC